MDHWRADVIILEQGIIIVLMILGGVRFSRWTVAKRSLSYRTDSIASRTALLEKELKRNKPDDTAVSHAVHFIHDDRESA